MPGTHRWGWAAWAVIGVCASAVSRAYAGGFEVPSQGARATGQADAFVAQADDPSAIYYNPAGLTQLDGTQVMAGLYAVYPGFSFSGPAGDGGMTRPAYLPQFYVATDLGLADWRFGLGVNNVFGVNENWGATGPLRTAVTSAKLTVVNIAPTVAWHVTDGLSLGLGLNLYGGDIELKNQLPFPAPPEGAFRFKGNDFTAGGTLGVLWKFGGGEPEPCQSVGVVYRSPFQLDFTGSARIDRPGSATVGPSDAQASVHFPQTLTLGYAVRPGRQWRLEADVEWADWNTLNQVALQTADPRLQALPPRRFDYHSSWTGRLGVEYRPLPHWALRAGYAFSQSATPDQTFNPVVVDLNNHIFTAGLGYSRPGWAVDVAYRFILGEDRTIHNSVNSPPGTYRDQSQAIMASFTLRF